MSDLHVLILKRARPLISSKRERFICNAVRYAVASMSGGRLNLKAEKAANEIIRLIGKDLENQTSLGLWLRKYGYRVPYGGTGCYPLLEARLAWIDALIEYWRDK